MRKTRNSFFGESNFQSYNPNLNGTPAPGPYQMASNYFYQGPNPTPNNYNTDNMSNDIESRLAKIERQLNRMDYRLSKLENNGNVITADDIETNTTNMYML